MVNKAKLTFLISSLISGYIIYRVHHYQQEERTRVRQGVLRDIERRSNKQQNLLLLQEQAELERSLSHKKD